MPYILVIGDAHIPDRAEKVPDKLKEIIEDGRPWDVAVYTGDFTGKEVLDWFLGLGKKTFYVEGNMDYLPLPRTAKFSVKGVRFGVHHGHGIYPRGNTRDLTRIAASLDVDVLLTGHTHSSFIKWSLDKKRLLVNPGSLTGAWGGAGGSMKPSMMIIEVNGKELRVILYELDHHNALKSIDKIIRLP